MVVLTLHSNENPVVCNFAEPLYGATHVRLSSALLYDNELTVRKQDTRLFRRYQSSSFPGLPYKPTNYFYSYERPPMIISPGYYGVEKLKKAIYEKENEESTFGEVVDVLIKIEPGSGGTTYQIHGDFDETTIPPPARLKKDGDLMSVSGSPRRVGLILPSKRFLHLFWGHTPTPRSTFEFNKLRRANDFFIHCDMVDDRQQISADKMSTELAALPRDKGAKVMHYTAANSSCPWRLVRAQKKPHTKLELSVRDQDGDLLDFHGDFSTFVVEII